MGVYFSVCVIGCVCVRERERERERKELLNDLFIRGQLHPTRITPIAAKEERRGRKNLFHGIGIKIRAAAAACSSIKRLLISIKIS